MNNMNTYMYIRRNSGLSKVSINFSHFRKNGILKLEQVGFENYSRLLIKLIRNLKNIVWSK